MNDLEQVIAILERYLSRVNARVLLQRALRERGLSLESFELQNLAQIMVPLRKGIDLFVRESARETCLDQVAQLAGLEAISSGPYSVEISAESDISVARSEARRICEDFGTRSFTMHKVTTIVSELARNIISYTKGGKLEIHKATEPKRRIIVCAMDGGPGIPNLDQILSGRYRSKTGLGRGIIGTKQLADAFDISTGTSGTKITAEVYL